MNGAPNNSQLIVRNTVLLYFRMLLLMLIGLYTSRVILRNLGVSDYGVYTAVAGAVTVFTFLTNSIGTAISRFVAFELGREDKGRLQRIFSTSIIIQILASLLIVLLVETAGMWFLNNKMSIPFERMEVARFVLHCTLGMLVINLLSVPYNATIIAHERMGAFAAISILEAVLKLSVALGLSLTHFDKLKTYALLMLLVALLVRFAYASFCRRHFAESRAPLKWDGALVRQMAGFAGWNFFGSSAYVFNTQGLNVLSNVFFGVVVSASRGIATQVEGIAKQFVSNIMTAFNPQITKSWAAGDCQYCFKLVSKASKYAGLVMLAFITPLWIEAEPLISLWLAQLPEYSADFVRLTMICLFGDMFFNPLLSLQLATGRIRKYYIITGISAYCVVPLSYLAFKCGMPPQWAYIILALVYVIISAEKLLILKRQIDFPVRPFLRNTVLPVALVGLHSIPLALLSHYCISLVWLRISLVCLLTWSSMAVALWFAGLDEDEKEFIFRKTGKWWPDRLFIRYKFRFAFGRFPDLRHPVTFNEKLQYLKLHDHREIYHRMVDKAEVKELVASLIGEEFIIPTLGVWDTPDQIPWDELPESFVLKCTHDSGSAIVVRDKDYADRGTVLRSLADAQNRNFYKLGREWPYKDLKPRIICEECLEGEINDYKFFCFDGQAAYMFIATGREDKAHETCFDFYDMDFKHINVTNGHPNAAVPPAKPQNWEKMKELAAVLSRGIKHVRVDFYEVGGQLYFGEYTFFHWGGFVRFCPDDLDNIMGRLVEL